MILQLKILALHSDDNKVIIISKDGKDKLEKMSKKASCNNIFDMILEKR